MPRKVGLIDDDIAQYLLDLGEARGEELGQKEGPEYKNYLKEKDALAKALKWNEPRAVMPTYKTLAYLLDYAGISLVEMFAHFDIEVTWPDEEVESFYERIHSLSEEQQIRLFRMLTLIGTSAWYSKNQEDTKMFTSPTRRAIWYIRRKYNASSRAKYNIQMQTAYSLGPEFKDVWNDHKYYTTVSTKTLPSIAKSLKISLYWLIGNTKILVLASTILEEQIMTAYMFLSQQERIIAHDYLELTEREEIA